MISTEHGFIGTLMVPNSRKRQFFLDEILEGADVDDVVMLVVGDPFGATTHTDLVLRAKERNIPVSFENLDSIINFLIYEYLEAYGNH